MKQTIRLNESDLHRIVKECVEKILREGKKINHVPYQDHLIQKYGIFAGPDDIPTEEQDKIRDNWQKHLDRDYKYEYPNEYERTIYPNFKDFV